MNLPARQPDPLDVLVEAAFHSEPLEEAPASLAESVMRRVRSTAGPAAAIAPRFRLTWLDYTLSLFFAILLGSVPLLAGSLPPQLSLYLQLEGLYFLQKIIYQPVYPVLVLGGAFLLVGGSLLVGVFGWRVLRDDLGSGSIPLRREG